MIPVLYNKDEKQFRTYGLGELADYVSPPEVTRVRNADYQFYMRYKLDGELSDKLEEGMKIKSDAGRRTKWQTFEITRVKRESGQYIEVWANHISLRTMKDAIRPNTRVNNGTAEDALRTWRNALVGDDDWDVWSDITTTANANWQIDRFQTARDVLGGVQGSILDTWGGEYEFDNQSIRLHREMGRKAPILLEYGRNITKVEQDKQETNVYTSVYPFARFVPEVGAEPQIYTMDGYFVDGKYIEMYDHRKILLVDFTDEFESEEEPTSEKLKRLATQYIERNEIGAPHENIKVEYIDLANTLDYEEFEVMEEVELNDTLPILYPQFNIINQSAKVVSITYLPTKNENKSIELGMVGQRLGQALSSGIVDRIEQIETEQRQQTEYIVNSQGNRIWYTTPDENTEHKVGDVWFEQNGQYTLLHIWNGNQWIEELNTEDLERNKRAIEQAQEDISEAQATADNALTEISLAVDAAGFTDMTDALTGIQSIGNTAQANAQTALNDVQTAISDAQTALNMATTAVNDVASIDVRVDEVEGTLLLKADSQLVDTLKGTVDNHTTQIQANAEGLNYKADASRVDTLEGTVQGLGTDIGVVAGRISSKVWNTDIESAIDGIEVGGRNLFSYSRRNVVNLGRGTLDFDRSDTPYGFYMVGDRDNLEDIRMYDVLDGNGFYTISFDLRGSQNGVGTSGVNINGSNETRFRTREDNDWERVSVTFEVTNYDYDNPEDNYIGFNPGWQYIWHRYVKVEKGNIATDWTPAPEDTLARFDHIETEWEQTFDRFSQTVSGIDGRVTAQKQTIDSISGTVGNIEGDIATMELNISGLQTQVFNADGTSRITQLSTLIDARVTTEELTNAISVSEQGILAQTVLEGEVVGRINQEAGRTLIQSDRLYLDAETTVFSGSAFIPSAAIESLTADKVTTGTLDAANVNIINLNVNSLVGNISEFIRTYWNGYDSTVFINAEGVQSREGELRSVLHAGAMEFSNSTTGQSTAFDGNGIQFKWSGNNRLIEQISEGLVFRPRSGSGTRLNSSLHLVTGAGVDKVSYLQLQNPTRGDMARLQLSYGNLSLRHPNSGELRVTDYDYDNRRGRIVAGVFETATYTGEPLEIVERQIQTKNRNVSQTIYIMPSGDGGLRVGSGGSSLWPVTALRFIEGSSRASKTNIVEYTEAALEKINELKVVEYNLKNDLERGVNRRTIGFIAEDSPEIAIRQSGNSELGVDHYKMTTLALKGVQELEQKNNQTLNLSKANEEKIHQLQQELSNANRKIEELERKLD